MLYDLSRADQLQAIAVAFVIFTVAFVALALVSMFLPETQRGAAALSAWVSSRNDDGSLNHELIDPAHPYAFREPADPAYVDALIRARGSAPVIYDPAPLAPRATIPAHVVGSRLDEVLAGPVSPRYVGAHAGSVGRHRAPEWVPERALALAAA